MRVCFALPAIYFSLFYFAVKLSHGVFVSCFFPSSCFLLILAFSSAMYQTASFLLVLLFRATFSISLLHENNSLSEVLIGSSVD